MEASTKQRRSTRQASEDNGLASVMTAEQFEEFMTKVEPNEQLEERLAEMAGQLERQAAVIERIDRSAPAITRKAAKDAIEGEVEDVKTSLRQSMRNAGRKTGLYFRPRFPNQEGDGFIIGMTVVGISAGARTPLASPFIMRMIGLPI